MNINEIRPSFATMKLFCESMCLLSTTAEEAAITFAQFTKELRKIIPKEYKTMELKLLLLKARADMLEQRGVHNNAIVKHIRRRIRNIENLLTAKN